MSDDLSSRVCVPCQGGIPPLTQAESEALLKQTPDWTITDEGKRLERRFTFRNFREALDFVTRVGEVADAQAHHPDISFSWGQATVSWYTKKIKGLHENDFIMAARTDQLYTGS